MSRAKYRAQNSRVKNCILNILLIIFLICIIVSGYNIIKWIQNNKKTELIKSEIEKAVIVENNNGNNSYNINFEQLHNINPEIKAWIKIQGTNIEYPVVQSKDNDFYLNHSLDKSENGAGWVFADYRNIMDGTDKNIIIYGHNRRDGSMFATLKDTIKKEWYENEENKIITLITENGESKYQVFSTYQIEKENYDTTTGFNTDEEFMNYVDAAKKHSIYDYKVEVNASDSILTLSTCANNNKYRVILHAKKIVEE